MSAPIKTMTRYEYVSHSINEALKGPMVGHTVEYQLSYLVSIFIHAVARCDNRKASVDELSPAFKALCRNSRIHRSEFVLKVKFDRQGGLIAVGLSTKANQERGEMTN